MGKGYEAEYKWAKLRLFSTIKVGKFQGDKAEYQWAEFRFRRMTQWNIKSLIGK